MKVKYLILVLSFIMIFSGSVLAVSFTDISEEHWAYKNVITLTENKIISGYPDGTFRPEGTISKAEFIKLVIAASLPEGITIDGAPSAFDNWAGKYVAAAEIYQVIAPGSITPENMNEPITRMEMALMISKADIFMRYNELKSDASITYNDYDDMNAEEIRYLTHAVSKGLIKGYTDNTFKPDKNMTRAEAATMIFRYTDKGGEE